MDPGIGSVVTQFDPRIAALLGWVVVAVKVLVDWLKTVKTMPAWAPPALAFLGACGVLVILMLALDIPLTPQLLAQGALSALVATVLAIGQTALQARTKPSEPTSPPIDGAGSADTVPSVTEIADELERRSRTSRVRKV
jgi:hypothetical protein